MLFKNLFSIALIASSVFAAPPPQADSKTPSANADQNIGDKFKAVLHNIATTMEDEVKPHRQSFQNNKHIQGCAQFNKEECKNWINSIKGKKEEFNIVQKIIQKFPKSVASKRNVSDKGLQARSAQDFTTFIKLMDWFEESIKAFESARDIFPTIATAFFLGMKFHPSS